MTEIYVDGDACPVRDEVYRVAERLSVVVHVVSNGSRPIRPAAYQGVKLVFVDQGADVADDWIADRIGPKDLCVTADIPLASRCLAKGAKALSPKGNAWTPANIGSALAGRELSRHLREIGAITGGQAPMGKADKSRFIGALDETLRALLRAG